MNLEIYYLKQNKHYQAHVSLDIDRRGEVRLKMFLWCGYKLDMDFRFPVTENIRFK